jgi:hypothetical protein
MWRLRRKDETKSGGIAVADRPPDYEGSTEDLWDEIEQLTSGQRDREAERRVLRLRHIAGIRAMQEAEGGADFADPAVASLPDADGLPEFARDALTPGLLRAGILRDGCVLVRGLIDRDRALAFADQIDRAFSERDRESDARAEGYYEEFVPSPPYTRVDGREWIREGGGVLAADSPMVAFEMFDLFRDADLAPLVDCYLGEPGLISVHKTTLRKAAPSVPGAWHQDGTFMGPVRSLNLWLSLSRCGDVAPGLDLVPRRLEQLVAAGTDDAMLGIQTSTSKVMEAAGDTPILRPIFEPGDALFFDELFLHQTASDPSMPNSRYAIENWFFGASSFPEDYAPIATW